MNFTIRKATSADMQAIHDLVAQLAIYERAADQVETNADTYSRDFESGAFDAILAIHGDTGEVVGMALYYFAYSTWKGKYLWLEDFIVSDAYRGKGIGKMLFDAVTDIAQQCNAFMKFQVLDWNTPAMQFYDRYQVAYEKEWITCRKRFTH